MPARARCWSLRCRSGRRSAGHNRDAQRELRKLLGAIDKGVIADAGKLTVGAWLEQWIEEARNTVSPNTHERYVEIVNKHLVPTLGAHQLVKLARLHIQNFYSDALESGRLDGKAGCRHRPCCTSIASATTP
jgi:hypothetical protein